MKHYLRFLILVVLSISISVISSCSRNRGSGSTDGESVVPESVSPIDSERAVVPDSTSDVAMRSEKPAGKPVVLEFSATWCGPCARQKPIYEEAIKKYGAQIDMRSIDVDENPELADRYHINAIPAFVFIDAYGKVVGKANFLEADQLDEALKNLLAEKM